MSAGIGHGAALAGLALAGFGAVLSVAGAYRRDTRLVRAGRLAALALLPLGLLMLAVLMAALVRHDFSFAYVAENNSVATPAFYSAITVWGSLEGSIVLWVAVLATYVAAAAIWGPRRAPELYPVAQFVLLAIAAFFFWLVAGPSDPFGTLSPAPADGPGPNPLLQNHPLMGVHPPLLYLGLVGFSVPFAFAIAALVTGRLDERWIQVTRGTTLAAWVFLAAGNVLGAAWSYAVLGWGGYFAWDPVENVALLPWLTATALIHSVMVQERREMLKLWNLTLVVATFLLTILATFLTRSGVLASVHAFADGIVGPALLAFMGVVLAASIGLLVWRGERLRTEGELDAAVSRESAYLLNNLLLVAVTLTVLLGTLFPLLVEALDGTRLSVGEPYFNATAVPIMVALLFLMGVGPALPWRRTSGASLRRRLLAPAGLALLATAIVVAAGVHAPLALVAIALGAFVIASVAWDLGRLARRRALARVPRRVGGQIVHAGVAVMAVGIAVSASYQLEGQATLRRGEAVRVGERSLRLEAVRRWQEPRREVVRASLRLDDGAMLQPALNLYRNARDATASPAIRASAGRDVYAVLVEAAADGSAATVRVFLNPLVSWIWAGGAIMGLGVAVALWPRRRRLVAT